MCCPWSHERFKSFSSASTVRRQVDLGLPGFLFPGGFHLKAILGAVLVHPQHMFKPTDTLVLYLTDDALAFSFVSRDRDGTSPCSRFFRKMGKMSPCLRFLFCFTTKCNFQNLLTEPTEPPTVLFSEVLLETVSDENLRSWIGTNRSTFVLVK